jgi:hypothetical protein
LFGFEKKNRVRLVAVGQLERLPSSLRNLLHDMTLDYQQQQQQQAFEGINDDEVGGSEEGDEEEADDEEKADDGADDHGDAREARAERRSIRSSSQLQRPPKATSTKKKRWVPRMTLVLALSYGGRAEIAQAAKTLARKVCACVVLMILSGAWLCLVSSGGCGGG